MELFVRWMCAYPWCLRRRVTAATCSARSAPTSCAHSSNAATRAFMTQGRARIGRGVVGPSRRVRSRLLADVRMYLDDEWQGVLLAEVRHLIQQDRVRYIRMAQDRCISELLRRDEDKPSVHAERNIHER